MTKYHKIDSLFKRDEKGNFLVGELSRPEFRYLAYNEWVWTEKVDGTNIRVIWDGPSYRVTIGGRTDNAQIPSSLINSIELSLLLDLDQTLWEKKFSDIDDTVILYGEGYGAGIQSGGKYRKDVGFILFDVRVGDWWLKREDVADVADYFGLKVVPQIGSGNLFEAYNFLKEKPPFKSLIAEQERNIEGIVMRPAVELFDRGGNRIITKLKYKDFK